MNGQKEIWDRNHAENAARLGLRGHSSFAGEVMCLIPGKARILELGCGVGNDAAYFAAFGHNVVAVDFSDTALEEATKQFGGFPNLTFVKQDIGEPFAFGDGEFDFVYARLSLHYFPDAQTKKVFGEIARVLRPGGAVAFICKSVMDPLYGKGTEIERDMFETDHVRHFFSEEYAAECLGNRLEIQSLMSGEDNFFTRPSAFVKAIGRKK